MLASRPHVGTVVLVGFMGAGKSTVGRLLAERLGCPFVDLDARVEACADMPVARIFETRGEAAFRRLELQALEDVLREARGAAVIATGGGAVETEAVRTLLRTAPGVCTVYLDAPLPVLRRRCAGDGDARPLLREPAEFEARHRRRRPLYEAADLRVETAHRTPEETAGEIVRLLGGLQASSVPFSGDHA